MTKQTLEKAHGGGEQAFRELTDPYRRELQLHCYRILGSVPDAEDMLQETLLDAWRALERFEGRSSLRAWLYRIATNRCLSALRERARRPRAAVPQPPFELPEPTRWVEPRRLEPYPDAMLGGLVDLSPGPDARYETRETIELAFVAALQHLPARQRAVLVLRDALGFHGAEVADMLDSSTAAVKGALQRARATLEAHLPPGGRERAPLPASASERALAGRFADAFASNDVDGILALLTDDAWLTMPPAPTEYQGHAAIAGFLAAGALWRGNIEMQLVATRANTQPAFGCYMPDRQADVARAVGLLVLTLHASKISAVTIFVETRIFAYFGLPQTMKRLR